jgi:FkbM family methyltransferase
MIREDSSMKIVELEDFKLYVRDEMDLVGMQNGRYEAEETDIAKTVIQPSDVAVDIGANIGYFSILMAKRCRYVYAFEPSRDNIEILEKNIRLNELSHKISAYRNAISDSVGEIKLHLCPLNHGMHRIYPSQHCVNVEPVGSIKLDTMINLYPSVNFIKMDVEGAELYALRGMRSTIEKWKPNIMMEFHPPSIYESGCNPRDIYDYLKNFDYDIMLIPEVDEISYEELYRRTNEPMGGLNILCLGG